MVPTAYPLKGMKNGKLRLTGCCSWQFSEKHFPKFVTGGSQVAVGALNDLFTVF